MTDQKISPTMTAEDFGAALSAFAVSFAAVIRSPQHKTPNQILEALAGELQDMAAHMNDPEGNPTPAKDAVLITAAMLEASAPEGRDEP